MREACDILMKVNNVKIASIFAQIAADANLETAFAARSADRERRFIE